MRRSFSRSRLASRDGTRLFVCAAVFRPATIVHANVLHPTLVHGEREDARRDASATGCDDLAGRRQIDARTSESRSHFSHRFEAFRVIEQITKENISATWNVTRPNSRAGLDRLASKPRVASSVDDAERRR